MATKDNQARVGFAPGRKNAYVIVRGEGNEPYPGDLATIYEGADGLERAQARVEWLNWNAQSKQANKFSHPREEAAAKAEQARADLLAAHRALKEEEYYGKAVATQLRAIRAEKAREEHDAEQWERKARQASRSVKERRESRVAAKNARARAHGLAEKIAALEQTPPLPSRLAAQTRETQEASHDETA